MPHAPGVFPRTEQCQFVPSLRSRSCKLHSACSKFAPGSEISPRPKPTRSKGRRRCQVITGLIRATTLSEDPQSAASRLIARPERSTRLLQSPIPTIVRCRRGSTGREAPFVLGIVAARRTDVVQRAYLATHTGKHIPASCAVRPGLQDCLVKSLLGYVPGLTGLSFRRDSVASGAIDSCEASDLPSPPVALTPADEAC